MAQAVGLVPVHTRTAACYWDRLPEISNEYEPYNAIKSHFFDVHGHRFIGGPGRLSIVPKDLPN